MTTIAPRLPDSAAAANGRRYTAEDKEAAYLSWVTVQRRSFAKTSDATGVAESTLREWAKGDDWFGRAREWDAMAAESAKVAVFSTVTDEIGKSIQTVVAIRDDLSAPAKVRLDAALSVLAIAGIHTKPQPAHKPSTDPAPGAFPVSFRVLSAEEQQAAGARLAALPDTIGEAA